MNLSPKIIRQYVREKLQGYAERQAERIEKRKQGAPAAKAQPSLFEQENQPE